jgi:hypothetical protein
MKKAIEIQAPNTHTKKDGYTSIFLGGSIGLPDSGKATDWQQDIIKSLEDEQIQFLNPRRSDWDSSWEQKATNPEFRQQVLWELLGLEVADIIIMYFDPNTKSPISLLELGLYASSGKLIVCCPEPFWRKGNVDIVCEMYDVTQVNTIEEVIKKIKSLI